MPIVENQLKDFVTILGSYLIFPLLYRSKTCTFLLSQWKIRFHKAAIAYTLIYMMQEGTKSFKKSLRLQHAHFYYVLQLLYYRSVRKLMYLLKYTFMFN